MTGSTSVDAESQCCRERWNAAEEKETHGDDENFLNLDYILQNSLNCTL